jgi:hypothetical protein
VTYPDPLSSLAVPTTSNGVVNAYYNWNGTSLVSASSPQNLSVNAGQTATLQPGIYQSITVQGGASAIFTSGIYVLAGGGLTVSGSSTVSNTTGGVMFYNTATNYNATTGADGSNPNFQTINITGGSNFNLTGLTSTANSTFSGMLIFQDRLNSQTMSVSGNSSTQVGGTVYAPFADLKVSGGSTFYSQFIVGQMEASGGSTVTINPTSQGQGNQVYLVE